MVLAGTASVAWWWMVRGGRDRTEDLMRRALPVSAPVVGSLDPRVILESEELGDAALPPR
jgi:hypothetical protein